MKRQKILKVEKKGPNFVVTIENTKGQYDTFTVPHKNAKIGLDEFRKSLQTISDHIFDKIEGKS